MMAGALIYLLGNDGSTVEVHYKSVGGFYPEILQLAANFKDRGRRRGKTDCENYLIHHFVVPLPQGGR